jgi:hypothetical protein
MSSAHWHLALVHLPVVFVPFATVLLMLGLWQKQAVLKKLAAFLFVASALVAVPAFLTGEPAEEQVEDLPLVSEPIIEAHEEAAEFAFYTSLAAGVFGLGVLLTYRRQRVQQLLQHTLIAVGVASSLALLRAANLGGQVRHSEIRDANSLTAPTENEKDDD